MAKDLGYYVIKLLLYWCLFLEWFFGIRISLEGMGKVPNFRGLDWSR